MKTFKEYINSDDRNKSGTMYNMHGSHAKLPEKNTELSKSGTMYNMHGSHAKCNSVSTSKDGIKEAVQHDMFGHDGFHEEYGSFESKFLKQNDNPHLGRTSNAQTEELHKLHPLDGDHRGQVFRYTESSTPLTDALVIAYNEKKKAPVSVGGINIKQMDSNIKSSKTRFHTYSGAGFSPYDLKPIGKSPSGNYVYAQPTYMSASHDKTVASRFARRNRGYDGTMHIFHFDTQVGEPTIFAGRHSHYDNEHETIHPRTDSTPEQYHLEHYGTTTYHDGDGQRVDVHHVRRIPKSEVIPLKGKK